MFRVGVTYEEEEKLEGDGAEAHKVEMVKCSNVAEHQIFYNPFPFLHNINSLCHNYVYNFLLFDIYFDIFMK